MPNAFLEGGSKKEAWGRGVSAGSDRLASSMAVTRTRTIGREAVRANTAQKARVDGWMGALVRQRRSWTALKHLLCCRHLHISHTYVA